MKNILILRPNALGSNKILVLLSIFLCLFPLKGSGHEDSLLLVKDTIILNYSKPPYIQFIEPENKTEIYDSIARFLLPFDSIYLRKSKKYDLRNEIKNIIYLNKSGQDLILKNDEINFENIVKYYNQFEGRPIRNINFKQVEVFGQSLSDTIANPDTWFEKLINGLHIKTQEQFLYNRLLFEPKDKVDPMILADNERLIRDMSNIQDVRILVEDTRDGSDSVDILLITKDVLPLGFGIELFDINKGQVGFWNKNLLGLGHELYYNLLWDYLHTPNYGHRVRYRINSLGNTFISADATYENQWNKESFKFYLNRTFFTPQTKYAGGIGFENNRLLKNISIGDSVFVDKKIKYDFTDAWIGRSFLLSGGKNKLERQNISLTGRLINYKYTERPVVSETMFYDYSSRIDFLGSIDLSNQSFIKSRFIYNFGKPEDLPLGSLLKLTAGYEINEFNRWPYFGMHYSSARYNKKLGYLYQSAAFGGFYNNGIKQGTISLSARYFTRLINADNRFKYRFFASINYTKGINRFNDEYIELSNSEGIRGLTSIKLRGMERFSFRLENDCYSPHSLYGFKLIYFLFYDAGVISENKNKLFSNYLYSGVGIGVKIRNENLVFNTVVIRLSYYPRLPDTYNVDYFDISGTSLTSYPTFESKKPEILKFQNQ